jgi:hypothetical protein
MSLKNLFKTQYIYIYIFLYNLILFFLSTENYKYSLMRKDQQIMTLSAGKMFYFDYNTFEAAWNHHTPPIFYLFKLIYRITDFTDIYNGFFILYSFLLLLINLFLFKLIFKFIDSTYLAFIFSSLFIYDISITTVGEKLLFDNRTVGILFQILILLTGIKILESFQIKYIVTWSLISSTCIFFLESYLISIVIIYLYLLYKIGKKLLIYSQITFIFSTVTYFLTLLVNGEVYETIQLNYFFHLFGTTRKMISLEKFLNNGLFKPDFYFNFSVYFFILSILLLGLFMFSQKFRFIYNKKFYSIELLYVTFLAELLHLIASGPRFTNYFQLILIFVYLLPIITLFYLLRNNSKQIVLMTASFLVLFLFFTVDNKNEFLLYRFNKQHEITNLNSQQKDVITYLNKQTSDVSQAPSLQYIWGDDKNFELYFETNTLPATRMWWWFNMYYAQQSDYIFEPNRFYSKNLSEKFVNDLKKEEPKNIIVQDSFVSVPEFLLKILDSNYYLKTTIGDYKIFEINY